MNLHILGDPESRKGEYECVFEYIIKNSYEKLL